MKHYLLKKNVFIVVILLIFNGLSAQEVNIDTIISIKIKHKPLEELLKEISDKSGTLFSFSPDIIPVNKLISLKAKNKPVKEILDEISYKTEINWQVVESQVVLKSSEKNTSITNSNLSKEKFTISGYVKDNETGEYLSGASVYIPSSSTGTIANAYGFFSLTLPKGKYKVAFSFVGYTIVIIDVNLIANRSIEMSMLPNDIPLGEIEVKANEIVDNFRKHTSGEININPAIIHKTSAAMGEPEVIKTLQSFPGVLSGGDGSIYYFVRGGQKDQNLILVDEAPVYNPSHLMGLFSSFVPEAVKDFKFYKSDIPSKYGGRLSSVLDIVTREGNKNKFSGNIGIGPAAFHLELEGPLKKETSSWFLSFRKSNINWLFKQLYNNNISINFIDLNAKTNIRLGNKDRIFLSFYFGNDELMQITSADKYGLQWYNLTGTLRWNHLYNEKLFSNTTLYASRYNYNFYISQKNGIFWNTNIGTLGLKSDLTFYKSPQSTFIAGAGLATNTENPGNLNIQNPSSNLIIPVIEKYFNKDIWLYFGHNKKFSKLFSINYGLRLPSFLNNGPSKEYYFDNNYEVIYNVVYDTNTVYNFFINPEPRFSLKFSPDTFWNASVSYTHTVQYLRQIGTSQSPFTSLEVWYPSGPALKPSTADQVSLSLAKLIIKKDFEISIEGYYKWMHNIIDYADHAKLLINPLIKGELRLCEGQSYGVELLAAKNSGRLTYWLGYVWSRSYLQSPDINNGVKYTAYYDHPHTINFNIHYQVTSKFAVSSTWIYSTGAPYTVPTSFFWYQGIQVPVYARRNNVRLPDYHRLDFTGEFLLSGPLRKIQHKLTFTIYNVYNRHNPFSVNFNKIINNANSYVAPVNTISPPEILSTYKYVFGIVPSVTYLLQF